MFVIFVTSFNYFNEVEIIVYFKTLKNWELFMKKYILKFYSQKAIIRINNLQSKAGSSIC